MFFTQLALLALSAAAAYVGHFARDLSPPVATLNTITAELEMIDFDVDPESLNSASNTSAAFVVDGNFESVNAVTVDASLQVLACVSSFGVAAPDDANYFIHLANTTYVPELLSVLNKTIAAKPIFLEDSLPDLDLVAIILADLKRYNTSNEFYLGNLTNATPPQNMTAVMEIRQVITKAFDEVIAAYECPGASTECSGTTTTTTSTHSITSSVTVKSSTSSTTASHTTTSPPAATSLAAAFGQCGGIGWTGPTICVSGSVCSVSNQYYSQCLPTS
ncbi:hypothetical protein FB45DRAFT_1112138 [Roridomyces roridus]|uniref:CBM1 domain-containing protein n=1 Tax=Roridomyces roridus TaxID=1738132 RepID=A0AAD7B8F5_9AGAR|nr:hypothetical protein FB45DRAFT_1112138 [Roridomyces roridus]